MKISVRGLVLLVTLTGSLTQTAPAADADPLSYVSTGLKQFAIDLLLGTSSVAGPNMNIVLSPYSVWAVLVLIMEGAAGRTYSQIRDALYLPENNVKLRSGYRLLERALKRNLSNAEWESVNCLFTDLKRPVSYPFESTMTMAYHANIFPVNFTDPQGSSTAINDWVANATHSRITELVRADDMQEAQLLLANAVFFKGQWKSPFNKSFTSVDKFHDEQGNELGDVEMMYYKKGKFLYGYLEELTSHIIELPYEGDKFCLLALLPKKGTSLSDVLEKLKSIPLDEVYTRLKMEHAAFTEDGVDVYLPRVAVQSDFVLNVVLEHMGITDVFSDVAADLSRVSPHKLYLSKLIHKAEIQLTEEGTVASAATEAEITYLSWPSAFRANRPFAYFIIEKKMKLVLFAGKVSNPRRMR